MGTRELMISREELLSLVLSGKSGAAIGRKFAVSREAVRQKIGCSLAKLKDALWYANHYGHPKMADKQWLEAELREAKGATNLAKKFGDLTYAKIKDQAVRLGIDPVLCKASFYTEMVEDKCVVCHSSVRRTKANVRREGQAVLCSRKCFAVWIREVLWPRRREAARKARREKTQRKLEIARQARHAATAA